MLSFQEAVQTCPYVTASSGAILLILIAGLFQCCTPAAEHVHSTGTASSQVPILVVCTTGLILLIVHSLLSIGDLLDLPRPLGEQLCSGTDVGMALSFFLLVMLWTISGKRMRKVCGLRPMAQLAFVSTANVAVWIAGLYPATRRVQEGNGMKADGVLDVVVLVLGPVLWVLLAFAARAEKKVDWHRSERSELEDLLLSEQGEDMSLPMPSSAPVEEAGLLSRLSFSWMTPLLNVGAKRQLGLVDVPPLPRKDATELWAQRFQEALADEAQRARPSLLRAAHATFGREYYYLGAMQLVTDLLAFSGPVLLKLIVTFVQDHPTGHEGVRRGLVLLAAMVGCYLASTLISTQYGFRMARVQLHIRTAVTSAVYTQVLRTREAELRAMGLGSGEATNLITVDVNRMTDAASSFNQFWSLPIQVGITLYLLYTEVSFAFIAGLAVIVLMIPVNSVIAKAIARVTQGQMRHKDERVRSVDEMLHGIRALKLLGWEGLYASLLGRSRTQEVRYLSRRKYLDAWCVYFWAATPVLTSMATFTAVALSSHRTGHALTPASVFTTVSLLNMLIFPMNAFPWVINGLMEALVSKRRLQRFLVGCGQSGWEGMDLYLTKREGRRGEAPFVEIRGSFAWDRDALGDAWDEDVKPPPGPVKGGDAPLAQLSVEALRGTGLLDRLESNEEAEGEEEGGRERREAADPLLRKPAGFVLRDLSLTVARGEIVGVYGRVGSGKSSLLSAILGEMAAGRGSEVKVQARCRAFCSQTTWVSGQTLREAVLFGSPYDQQRYERVLFACALSEDVKRIGNGDLNQMGERGMTLSGGQRQQLSLARALYSGAELYLLDDIFSGLDGATAAHVARHAIYGLLREKGATVILVTHAMDLLYGADVVVGMAGGRVLTKARLVATGEQRRRVEAEGQQQEGEGEEEQGGKVEGPKSEEAPLGEEEGREEGGVKLGVYAEYVGSMGRGVAGLLLVVMLGMQLSANAFNFWLGRWAHDVGRYSDGDFLTISGVIAGVNSLLTLLRSFLFAYGGLRAARVLHDQLLGAMLHTTISFFDATPLGRILNRFAQDTYAIDDQLPFMLNIFLAQSFALVGTTVVLVLASRWTLLILAIISFFYYRLQKYYRATSRELKRLDSVARSPIFSHFTDTLEGAATIRAFSAGDRFLRRNLVLIDDNQRVSLISTAASQWLAFRLQMFGLVVVTFISASAIFSCLWLPVGSVDAVLVGLSLSYALPIVGNLNALLGSYAETEKELISVERVSEYIKQPPEPDLCGHGGAVDLPAVWPWAGNVTIQDLSLRYRPGLPLALDRICCNIQAGEKVGLVGRTGSGKSSLIAALFRLVPWQGSILIDGVPINRVSLPVLRASLAILPQSPTLFSGTIGSNLDPMGQHTDEEICQALQACRLDAVLGLEDGPESLSSCLAMPVAEKGSNFSVGQRQLLCLCRLLLRRTPVVCVDEATASLDVATDAIIRRTIAAAFQHATVITIAHRLSTVMELCSRVIVLSDGRIVETGNPRTLLKDRGSWFRRLTAEQETFSS